MGVELCHNSSRLKESWPLIGAGLEAWADQQLAATFTRDCLYYSTSLNARVDTQLLELYARAWSARWEDRTKADAFVAAMGRIREEMVRQYDAHTYEVNIYISVVPLFLQACPGASGPGRSERVYAGDGVSMPYKGISSSTEDARDHRVNVS